MKTILIDIIKEKVDISDNEIEILTSNFQIITKQKNEYLVIEGSKSLYLYFIIDGFVRYFHIDDGNEITTQISTTKDFVTSFESFLNNSFSKENIQYFVKVYMKTKLEKFLRERIHFRNCLHHRGI